MYKKIKLVFVMFFLFSSLAYAQVPHLINYQGRLTDKTGKPLEGAYDVTFKIYDAENGPGEMAPWEEKHQGMVIQKGIFSVLLGSVTNLDLPFDKPYFLEIKVGDEVMIPRQRIASVGYAIRAEKAEKLKDASAIESGVVPSARLGSGSASADTVLRGDQTWGTMGGWQNVQVFTSSGTWIRPKGVNKCLVEVVGGGGGGEGGGGGGGGYARKICSLTTESVPVVVGNGGDVSCDGKISSFGTFCSAEGGYGAITKTIYQQVQTSTYSTKVFLGGLGGKGIGGDINIIGQSGECGGLRIYTETYSGEPGGYKKLGGAGGNSMLGFGGRSNFETSESGVNYGGGGSGYGGKGAQGVVIVYY